MPKALVLSAIVLATTLIATAEAKKNEYVTCGSVITLKGFKAGTTISCKEVQYGGHGSGQNACTGMGKDTAEADRYFIIRGDEGEDCLQGTIIPKGMNIRLQHMASNRWLHSHRFRSMLSSNQEVSCFGSATESDDSDVWKVTWTGGSKHWQTSDKITLQHVITDVYLGATSKEYPQPLNGQKEIAGLRSKTSETMFTVAEGIYFPQRTSSAPKVVNVEKSKNDKSHEEL